MDKESAVLEKLEKGFFSWDDDFVLRGPRGRIEKTLCRGYRAVTSRVDKKKRVTVLQHRLVYRCFIGPIPLGMTINHKDGDKLNNKPENLEVLSLADNTRHSLYELGNRDAASPFTKGHSNANSKLTPEDVQDIRSEYLRGTPYRKLAIRFGMSPTAMYRVVANKSYYDSSYNPSEKSCTNIEQKS